MDFLKQYFPYPPGSEIAIQLQNIRDHALTWIKEFKCPTKRDEEWRFTDLSPLLEHRFEVANFVQLDHQSDRFFNITRSGTYTNCICQWNLCTPSV